MPSCGQRKKLGYLKTMTSILIADDHAVARAGYRAFLSQSGMSDIGEASNKADIHQQLIARSWNLLLLDIHLPDCNGMSILQKVRRDYLDTRVLIVSGLPEDQYAIEALRAGAARY